LVTSGAAMAQRENDQQDERAECAAPVPKQSRHVARSEPADRATRQHVGQHVPATTNTALTAVAAMTRDSPEPAPPRQHASHAGPRKYRLDKDRPEKSAGNDMPSKVTRGVSAYAERVAADDAEWSQALGRAVVMKGWLRVSSIAPRTNRAAPPMPMSVSVASGNARWRSRSPSHALRAGNPSRVRPRRRPGACAPSK